MAQARFTDEDRAEIAGAQRALADETERIRNDRTLSREGRQAKMAAAYVRSRERIDQVRTQARERTEARQRQLRSKLFDVGSSDPGAMISYRDALDRVDEAEVGDAERLLGRAIGSGDRALARAVAAKAFAEAAPGTAFNTRWVPLLERYADAFPDQREALEELHSLRTVDRTANFNESMQASLPVPSEIAHLPDHQFADMAEQAATES